MTAQPETRPAPSQLMGWTGFCLWALVGAGLVLGLISFLIVFLIPPVVLAVILARRSRWRGGPYLLGIVAGAGLPLLAVAALNWSDWHHRTIGDATPNPYYWGVVGICLLVAGIVAYEIRGRRNN